LTVFIFKLRPLQPQPADGLTLLSPSVQMFRVTDGPNLTVIHLQFTDPNTESKFFFLSNIPSLTNRPLIKLCECIKRQLMMLDLDYRYIYKQNFIRDRLTLMHLITYTRTSSLGYIGNIEIEVNLRPTVSRPVCLGVRHPSGTCDQFFFLLQISFRQLRVCYFVGPPLTRGRVCNLLCNCFWVLPEQSLLGRSPAELTAIFYCLI
jgi:hypothetical protein